MDITRIREEYVKASLGEGDVAADPIEQFGKWFDEAMKSSVPVSNAMTLATTGIDGAPEARIVLLKGFDSGGFVFFTNYGSAKGGELAAHPGAALVFFWPELERQVRIRGTAERVSAAESDEYFATRPLGSRIGALASPQSQVVPGREDLETRYRQAEQQYGDNPPRPSNWGGYRLKPSQFEYWQGRRSRLHDRLRYRLADGRWVIERLAP